ncbi:family 16 glycoside hydrolase, partial [Cryphonectria parasitica EP155]
NIAKNTDWVRQNWSEDATIARGSYGEMMNVDNAVSSEGDGLQITVVGGSETDGDVQGGEVDSARLDVSYGTFRSSMKLTGIAGTVSAFFWYYNDTQEIDIEFLSKQFETSNASYPVNLVLQSDASAEANYNAAHTNTYQVIYLPFDPRADFHEYRIDWVPGRVLFYADGSVLAEMDDPAAVPTHAGHLAVSQWSNGNPEWSGGPPASDAVLEIGYVKAYFNSSDASRQKDFAARCADPSSTGAVCDIPDVTATNSSAAGWFFSGQKNMTSNQTV